MLWFKETKSGNQIAINPKYVVAVFEVAEEGGFNGKTAISLTTGSIVVEDSLLDVVGQINGVR